MNDQINNIQNNLANIENKIEQFDRKLNEVEVIINNSQDKIIATIKDVAISIANNKKGKIFLYFLK